MVKNPTLPTELQVQVELPTIMPRSKRRPSVAYTEAQRAVENDAEIPYLSEQELIERIQHLRKERNAIILAHNYQIPIIQDLADFVGDSLQLSQQAAKTDAPLIVFCGVHFMAETAAILCPDKTVLIPEENRKDLAEIPENVKQGLEIVPVSHVDEVLERALTEALVDPLSDADASIQSMEDASPAK